MAEYNLGTASGRIVVDGSGAERGFSTATAAGQAFFGTIKDQIGQLDQFATKLTQIGAVSSAGFGIAITAASGFEARLSGIEAVSGATEAQMDAVRQMALRLGADTKFSASEAAQAVEELVKAGISVDEAIHGAADATVALAAAGEIALPRAAEIAANAMNIFDLSAQQLPKVADLIAGAANSSAITVEDFAQSMQQSGAAAKLAGIPIEDMATAIAILGNNGIKGSDAGTSLKTMLLNLIPVTDRQKEKFKELGFITQDGSNAFFDAAGNAKGLGEIADLLQTKLKGLTREQKLSALETMFGADAIRASGFLAEAGAKGWDEMAKAIQGVTAAQVAAIRMNNVRGALEELKGSLETAAIIIGSFFLPAIKRMIDLLTSLVNIFNDAPEGVQRFLAIVVGLGGGLSLLLGIMIKLAIFLGPLLAKFLGLVALKQVFSIFAAGFSGLRGGIGVMGGLAAMTGRAGVVFGRFAAIGRVVMGFLRSLPGVLSVLRVAIGFAFGPWGAAIALIITALTILYKRFLPFHDLVNRVAAAIKGGFLAAVQAARTAIDALVQGFQTGQAGGSGFLGFVRLLGAGARLLWNALLQVGAAFKANVLPALRTAGAMLGPILVKAFQTISEQVTGSLLPALRDLGASLAPLVPHLKAIGSAVLQLIGFFVKMTAIGLGVVVLGLIKLAQVIVTYVLPAIIQFIAFLISELVPAIAAVIAGVVKIISFIVALAAGFIAFWTKAKTETGSAATSIGAALERIRAWFVEKFEAARAAVATAVAAIVAVIGRIRTGFSSFISFVTGIWNAFWGTLFGQVVLNAVGLVGDFIKFALAFIRFAILFFIAAVKTAWTTFWSSLVRVVTTYWNLTKTVISAGLAVIRAVFTAGLAFLRARWQTTWAAIRAFTSSVLAVLRSIISVAWNAIRSVTSAVWRAIQAAIINPMRAAATFVLVRTAAVRAAIASAWSSVVAATRAAWNSFVTTISSAVSRALAVVRGIRSAVIGALAGAASWLYNAGVAVIQGFLNGINAMIGSVRAKLQELTSLIPDSKGPPVKDKKLLYDNGRFIIEGLIRGISSRESDLFNQLGRITSTIPQVAAPGPTTTNNANVRVTVPSSADPYQIGEITAQRILAKTRR